jgi:methylglutaconyl-CoA hydratase
VTLVHVETSDDGVRRITLNRPDRRNALSPELVAALTDAFRVAGEDMGTRLVILAAAGDVFCAGGDISSMGELSEEATALDAQRFADLFRTLAACPVPVIARVHGAALGGGTALAACADVVIAGRAASFGCTEVRVGIVPAVTAPYILSRVGITSTRRMMLSGERLSAEGAERIGLVDELCDDADLDERVTAVSLQLLQGHRHAQVAIKRLLGELQRCPPADVERLTLEETVRVRTSPEGRRAMAQFLASLKPGGNAPHAPG